MHLNSHRMERILKISSWLYAVAIAGLAVQQFAYGDFRPVVLPATWPAWLHLWSIWAYLSGAVLLAAAVLLVMGKRRRSVAMGLALVFLVLLLVFQVPYFLFVSQYAPIHLGLWSDPLRELALSGGAMVLASAYWRVPHQGLDPEAPLRNGVMSVGRLFFSVMLIAFGVDHFYYAATVATLIPRWIPWRYLWIYATGIILVCAGVCMLLKIRLAQVSLLTTVMLSAWLILLHIPQAIHMPRVDQGAAISRAFEVMAFIGTALVLYGKHSHLGSPEDLRSAAEKRGQTPLAAG